MSTAQRKKSLFSLYYEVKADISAPIEKVWETLTKSDYTTWDRNMQNFKGTIAQGEALSLVSKLSPKQTFKVTVTELKPYTMVWESGQDPFFKGKRLFQLNETAEGCQLILSENFSGIMIPVLQFVLPDFRDIFSDFAADLQKAQVINESID